MGKKIIYPDTGAGRIVSRQSNKITIAAALKVRMRVPAENISGFWQPKVKANPKNLERL